VRTEALLANVRARGIILSADGDSLRFDAPKGALTDALKRELQAHKAEIARLLARPLGFLPLRGNGVAIASAHIRPDGRGWVAIRSAALGGEIVLWVRDGHVTVPAELAMLVRYTVAELDLLITAPPEHLRAIHRLKKLFGSQVETLVVDQGEAQ
jgi:hypothetical protein